MPAEYRKKILFTQAADKAVWVLSMGPRFVVQKPAVVARRLSVCRGQTTSLPNLLRLYRRLWAEVAAEPGLPAHDDEEAMWLTALYRAEQPFDDTDWRWLRRRLMMIGLAVGDSPTHRPCRRSMEKDDTR